MYLEINLGSKCNLDCSYCYVPSISGEPDISFDLDVLIEFINKFDTIHGVRFTGGEPSMYMDKIVYILYNCKNIKSLLFVTNGILMDKVYDEFFKIRDILKRMDVLFILSLDTMDINKERGNIDGLKMFNRLLKFRCDYEKNISNRVNVEINRVVGKISNDRLEHMNNICDKNDVKIFNIPMRDYNHKILTSNENYSLIHSNINQINMCNIGGCCTKENRMLSIGNDGSLSICRMIMNRFDVKFKSTINDEYDIIIKELDSFCNMITENFNNTCLYEKLFD